MALSVRSAGITYRVMVLSAVGRHRRMMGSEASASPCCIRGRPHPRCLEASPQQCPRDGCCLVPTRDITPPVGGSPELQSHAGSRSLLDQRKAQPPMASPRSSEPNAAAQHLTRPRLDLQTTSCVFLKSRFLYRGSQLRALADWIRGHWTTRRAGDMEVNPRRKGSSRKATDSPPGTWAEAQFARGLGYACEYGEHLHAEPLLRPERFTAIPANGIKAI